MNKDYHINGKVIETQRLILRPFRQDDLNDFFEYASVDGVGEMAGWHHHEDRDTSQSILDIFITEDRVFAICLKENGKVIGSLGVEKYGCEDKFTEFDGLYGREIGYVLNKDYWGKGLMPEAVKAVISYLFDEIDLDFIICGYYTFNSQSKRVQEKLGFVNYRKVKAQTRMGTEHDEILNLLLNPKKQITLNFSHPETLIYGKGEN